MSYLRVLLSVICLTTTLLAPAHAVDKGHKETGLAAVYSSRLNGHRTASGQIYNASKLTTAHKDLPFGTMIRVTNPGAQRSVVVRVNDRGPVQQGRILDLTPAAARKIHIPRNSMRKVEVEVVKVGSGHSARHNHV